MPTTWSNATNKQQKKNIWFNIIYGKEKPEVVNMYIVRLVCTLDFWASAELKLDWKNRGTYLWQPANQ
jgi:hypothetical protein